MRVGTWPTEALREALPPVAVEVLGAAAVLADPTAILVGCALCYWFLDRERGVEVVAATQVALGTAVLLKGLVALPRPPAALHLAEASGYGFPSAHATGAVVLYGLVARHATVGTAALRAAGATTVALAVGVSRVLLGVHYATDVLAGALLGLLVLVAAARLEGRSPTPAFVATVATAGAAAALAGGSYDEALLLAGGGLAGCLWPLLGPTPAAPRPALAVVGAGSLAAGVAFLAAAGALLGGVLALVAGGAAVTALILLTPHAAARLSELASRRRVPGPIDRV